MTMFVSVAVFRRDGRPTFKAPRKEASGIVTQARKSASRFWNNAIQEPDRLNKIVVVSCSGQIINVAESNGSRRWVEYAMTVSEATKHPHIAACLTELGVDPSKAPPALPDTLEINGIIYRREI